MSDDSDEPFPDVPGPDMTRDTLYRLIEANPAELSQYGGLADLMDELGYPSIAHAYRWCWKRGKYPAKREHYPARGVAGRAVPGAYLWGWYCERRTGKLLTDVFPAAPSAPHTLPRVLILPTHKYYASHQAAVMDLAKWLQRLKDAHDLEPRKVGL